MSEGQLGKNWSRVFVGPRLKNRLKSLRLDQGWTQTELSERLGVSRQSVHAIETGKHDPSLPLAFRVANLFGMTIEDVFENPRKS